MNRLLAIVLVLSLMMGGAMWYSLSLLGNARQNYDSLSEQFVETSQTIRTLELRISALDTIPSTDFSIPDVSDFRNRLDFSQVNLLSMSENGNNELVIKLEGDYYKIAEFLAGVRTSSALVRTSHFNLKSDSDVVETDLTLEFMTED